MRKGTAIVGVGVALVIGIVVFGIAGDGIGSSDGDSSDYNDYQEFYEVETTAEQVVDPWIPGADVRNPSPGHHFVAIEIVVQNSSSSAEPYYVGFGDYGLTDSDDFVYGTLEYGATPRVSEVTLEPGQKTRGWITFEVKDGVSVRSLSDWFGENVALPD
ncbi:MAG: DUF4352 domain-containing protein [Dehalococcoidia bacterium]